MNFQEGFLFHVYNQGNNRRPIFFMDKNYDFFKQKIFTYILPYADVLAYCLMPNHFHLMIRVNVLELPVSSTYQKKTTTRIRSLNDSIGIMVRSYTNAINKQEGWTGSLFRKATRADPVNDPEKIKPSYFNTEFGTKGYNEDLSNYPQRLFNYIHHNPVKARLVQREEFWTYSSAKNYFLQENDELVDISLIQEFGISYQTN